MMVMRMVMMMILMLMKMGAQPWCKADARAVAFYFDEVAPLAVMGQVNLHDGDGDGDQEVDGEMDEEVD